MGGGLDSGWGEMFAGACSPSAPTTPLRRERERPAPVARAWGAVAQGGAGRVRRGPAWPDVERRGGGGDGARGGGARGGAVAVLVAVLAATLVVIERAVRRQAAHTAHA